MEYGYAPLSFFMLPINNILDSDQLSRIGCDDRMFMYLDSPGMVAYVVRGTSCNFANCEEELSVLLA